MVLTTTSFHLFGITPLICTPSLIRNLETTFAHPTRRKIFISSLIWTRGTVLDTLLLGFLKNIFCPSLICNGNAVLDTQKAKKYLHPSLIRTGKAQMHTLFERKFLISSLICNGTGCFLSLFAKFLFTCSHRAPTNYRVFLKSSLTNSHREMRIVHPVLKNRHKKRRLSFNKRQTNC